MIRPGFRQRVLYRSSSSSTARKASLILLSNNSSSRAQGEGNSYASAFAMTAATAIGMLGFGGMISLCEKDMKDPMTIYAKSDVHESSDAVIEEKGDESIHLTSNENKIPLIEIGATSPSIEESKPSQEEEILEIRARNAKRHAGGLKIFSGNGNMTLAIEIAKILGINLGKATVGKFADGEINVMIHENVRGKDVYVIQPTCPPVNDNLMELLLMVSTLNRASARRVTAVMPYYGYARQDRKMQVG